MSSKILFKESVSSFVYKIIQQRYNLKSEYYFQIPQFQKNLFVRIQVFNMQTYFHPPQLGFRPFLAYLSKRPFCLRGIRLQISYACLMHTLGREATCLFPKNVSRATFFFSLSLFTTHYLCDHTRERSCIITNFFSASLCKISQVVKIYIHFNIQLKNILSLNSQVKMCIHYTILNTTHLDEHVKEKCVKLNESILGKRKLSKLE